MASYYCGTGGNDTTGDGTSHATRWLTIQKALDTMTNAPTANRLNCTGSETLTASLSFTTYGTTNTQDTITQFVGYTTTEGDGGIFSLNGGGFEIINNDALDTVTFRLFKFTNWGSGTAFSLDNDCSFQNCEFDGEGVRAEVIDADNNLTFIHNKVHGIALSGRLVNCNSYSTIMFNYLQVDSATSADKLLSPLSDSSVIGNVLSMKTTSNCSGVELEADTCLVVGNSIFNQSAGTGSGILISSTASEGSVVLNNIIAGFSGTGGLGVSVASGSTLRVYGHNNFRNNTTNESLVGTIDWNIGSNDTLGSNPFVSTSNADHEDDDFAVGTVAKALAFPAATYLAAAGKNETFTDVGALQREEAVGGGSASGARNPLVGPIG